MGTEKPHKGIIKRPSFLHVIAGCIAVRCVRCVASISIPRSGSDPVF